MLTRRLGVVFLFGRGSSSGSMASLLAIGVMSWTCRPEALLARGGAVGVVLIGTGDDGDSLCPAVAAFVLEAGPAAGDDLLKKPRIDRWFFTFWEVGVALLEPARMPLAGVFGVLSRPILLRRL